MSYENGIIIFMPHNSYFALGTIDGQLIIEIHVRCINGTGEVMANELSANTIWQQ